jgi:hypothetical protein
MANITPPEVPLMLGDYDRKPENRDNDIKAIFEYLNRLIQYLYSVEV